MVLFSARLYARIKTFLAHQDRYGFFVLYISEAKNSASFPYNTANQCCE